MSTDAQFGGQQDARGLAMRGVHTLDELRLVIAGEICSVCGYEKRANAAFCSTDTAALPLPMRWSLGRGFEDPGFQDTFRSARRHLQLNPTRKLVFGGGWRYSSEDELRAAGYRWHSFTRCMAPGCGEQIHMYTKPDRSGRVAVNAKDYQPHRTSCTNPDYFQQRKEAKAAQTSARKKRRTR